MGHALVVFQACYSHIVPSTGGCGHVQLCQLSHSPLCSKGHGGKMSTQNLGFVSSVGQSQYRPSSHSILPELVAEDVKQMRTTCQALPHHIWALFEGNGKLGPPPSTEKSAEEYLAPGDGAPLGSSCPCPSCASFCENKGYQGVFHFEALLQKVWGTCVLVIKLFLKHFSLDIWPPFSLHFIVSPRGVSTSVVLFLPLVVCLPRSSPYSCHTSMLFLRLFSLRSVEKKLGLKLSCRVLMTLSLAVFQTMLA